MTTCELRRLDNDMEFSESFPPSAISARQARRFVRAALERHAVSSDAVELVTSELIANVVEHAQTTVTLRLIVGANVRLEVQDGNAIVPAVRQAAEDAEHGRGLFIVEALAQAWGVESTDDGKRIWVEIPRDEV